MRSTKQTIGLLPAVCLLLGCAAAPSALRAPVATAPASQPDDGWTAPDVMSEQLLLDPGASAVAMGIFRRAYLYGAELEGADLQGADLYRCQLGGADLRNADLRNANLSGAYLFKADLSGADLRGARFSAALKGAELKQTSLRGARFDASTRLPFSTQEAERRGMIPVETNAEVASSL